ncbi:MAG: S16 family serine protease, partial [Succinivibrio sp.]
SIAEATGRKFVRVALGGVNDEAEIRGHRRTYIGALPGRIISNMNKVGVNNPLFLLDEIDKVNSSAHGDPAAALLEVLDPEQNSTFNDNYVELDYDLSNVMFVTTANSYNIPGPLLDRMEIIDLSSYTEDEKFHIAREHLLPKVLRLANVGEQEVVIDDDTLLHLIRYYTHEAGVRELERTLTEIVRKTIKDLMIKDPKAKRFKKTAVTVDDIHSMLGPEKFDFTSKLKESKVGIVNGLSWSSLGGDILQLEAVANVGKGKHQLTGKLGDVMKESISTAITVVRTLSKDLKLDQNFFETCDLHVHVPEGAVPKDGPSAGVGMVTAVVSALTGNPVRCDVAMTGEITLRGDVLAIGGLKEKLLAAMRGGIKTVMIPKDNEKDLWDIPPVVSEKMTIKPVSRIEEVLKVALENDPYTFRPTTSWLLKEKKISSKNKRSGGSDSMNIVL